MTTTLKAARNRLQADLDLGYAIPNGAAGLTAIGATSITAPFFLADTNKSGQEYNGWIIHLPDTATAADKIRYATTNVVTTGVLSHGGASYSAGTQTLGTQTAELWKNVGLRPDYDVFNAINQALEYIYFHAWEPLSLAPDAAMRETGVTSWGTHVNATEAKQTTAARVFPGFIRSLAITCTSAHGYLPTADIFVTPGEMLLVAAISRTNSGTSAELTPWDATNSAAFGTTITNALNDWQFQWQIIAAPAGCKKVNIRLGGTGASDVTDWQALWFYRVNAPTPFILPASYLNEKFELESIAYSNFLMSSGAGNFEAQSMKITEIPRDNYSFEVMNPAANPAFVQFHRTGWFSWPLWIQMRLPYSERGLYTTETSTSDVPLHLLAPQAIIQLLEPGGIRRRVPNGDVLYAKAQDELKKQSRDRETEGPAQRSNGWRFPSLVS